MRFPLGVLAALATLGGFLNIPAFLPSLGLPKHAFDTYLGRAIPQQLHHIPANAEWLLTVLAVVAGVVGLGWAWLDHRHRRVPLLLPVVLRLRRWRWRLRCLVE